MAGSRVGNLGLCSRYEKNGRLLAARTCVRLVRKTSLSLLWGHTSGRTKASSGLAEAEGSVRRYSKVTEEGSSYYFTFLYATFWHVFRVDCLSFVTAAGTAKIQAKRIEAGQSSSDEV